MMPFNPFKEKYLKNCWADLILRLSYEYWLVLLVFSNSLYLFLTNSKIQKVELIKFPKLDNFPHFVAKCQKMLKIAFS